MARPTGDASDTPPEATLRVARLIVSAAIRPLALILIGGIPLASLGTPPLAPPPAEP